MLDIKKHKLVLQQILQDFYSDNELTAQLVFKGGTCLMLFYDLDRFSTDLDFDLRLRVDNFDSGRVNKIVGQHLDLTDVKDKHWTYFWQGSYQKQYNQVKIEINKRDFPQKVVIKNYFGLNIATLAPEQMLAHKLCAITDRKILQNRDLYDAHFMLSKNWDIDGEIIKFRTRLDTEDYLQQLVTFLGDAKIKKNILSGLGEVLIESKKDWVKDHLVNALQRQLMMRV